MLPIYSLFSKTRSPVSGFTSMYNHQEIVFCPINVLLTTQIMLASKQLIHFKITWNSVSLSTSKCIRKRISVKELGHACFLIVMAFPLSDGTPPRKSQFGAPSKKFKFHLLLGNNLNITPHRSLVHIYIQFHKILFLVVLVGVALRGRLRLGKPLGFSHVTWGSVSSVNMGMIISLQPALWDCLEEKQEYVWQTDVQVRSIRQRWRACFSLKDPHEF